MDKFVLHLCFPASVAILSLLGCCQSGFKVTIFPHNCIVCTAPVHTRISLCRSCEEQLPWQPPGCRYCGIMLTHADDSSSVCGKCQQALPAFDSCHALFEYCSPVQELISNFKYQHQFAPGKVFGQLLMQAFKRHYEDRLLPELLIPVPLHKRRLQQRGFNQSALLAKEISKNCSIPTDISSCIRQFSTPAQRGLNATDRARNIFNAFSVNSSVGRRSMPDRVAIIDDVVTTTATVNELAWTLRQVGVREIDVWALARVN